MLKQFLDSIGEKARVDSRGRIILDSVLAHRIMQAIKEKKIPLVLDESDIAISIGDKMPNSDTYDGEVFTSLNDLVAVHITAVPIAGDTIKTQEEGRVTHELKFVDPSTKIVHSIPYVVGNDTIHFTLNCAVHNHESGNDWDNYKYGILVDFKKLDKNKVLDVKSEDTFVDGSVHLDCDYYLFCPLGEGKKLAEDNPRATIIEYTGISLADAMSCMIVYSGRKLEPYGPYGWGKHLEEQISEDPDIAKLEKLVISNGYPVLKGNFGNALHSETKYMARRMWKREYEALINLIRYNQEHNINMPDDILVYVLIFGGAYGLPGTVPVTLDDFKEVVLPILRKYGYEVDDSLFDGIVADKSWKIINYSLSQDGIPQIMCPDWENVIRSRIINLLKNNRNNKR